MKHNWKRRGKALLTKGALAGSLLLLQAPVILASSKKEETGGGELKDSAIVKGTEELFQDISSALMVVAPIVGGAVLAFLWLTLQSAEDEQDVKMKKKKIKTCIVATIGVFLSGTIINLVTKYYK